MNLRGSTDLQGKTLHEYKVSNVLHIPSDLAL